MEPRFYIGTPDVKIGNYLGNELEEIMIYENDQMIYLNKIL